MLSTIDTAESKQKLLQSDGIHVAVRTWRPTEPALATLVIVPGFKAHSGRYREVAEGPFRIVSRPTRSIFAGAESLTASAFMSESTRNMWTMLSRPSDWRVPKIRTFRHF